jgi:hypothetical protein
LAPDTTRLISSNQLIVRLLRANPGSLLAQFQIDLPLLLKMSFSRTALTAALTGFNKKLGDFNKSNQFKMRQPLDVSPMRIDADRCDLLIIC